MVTETNPFYYATNEQGGGASPPIQIQDSIDFPHTGLIKALQQGMQGNYAIKSSANEFDITQIAYVDATTNVVSVSGGTVFENGALVTVSGTTNFTSSSFNATDGNYHLLVCNGGTLAIRKYGSSTIDRIPEFVAGDVIIAVIKYTSDGFGSMEVQYLTTSKTENFLSIGYDNSGYTEKGTITADANGILITGPTDVSLVGASDRVYIKDATDNTLKTVTPQSIADLTDLSSVIAHTDIPDSDTGFVKRTGVETYDIDTNTYLTAETDTLDTVTARGNNTANSIIVGGFTNTGIMNLSKVASTTANFSPANPTIDEYVHYVNEPSNAITLPSAATNDGIVLNIKNVNTTALVITPFAGDVIDNGQITDARTVAPNIISLDTYESITLQALTDAVSPLVTGWYILDTDTGGAEVNDLTASVTWANVPDANITESSVTQHREAIQDRIIVETGNDSPASSAAESGNYFYRASGETATFTVPNDSYVGEYYVLMNNSGSSITISKDAGDTLIGTTSVSDGAAVTIICVASNTWFVIG